MVEPGKMEGPDGDRRQDAVASERPAGAARPAPVNAGPVKFAMDATIDDTVAEIFRAVFDQWAGNEAAVVAGLDPEGIHEMRVGLRRMRAALGDFKTVVPAVQLGWMKRETRWLLDSLGTARNWDVLLAELLAPLEAALPGDGGLADLRGAVQTARQEGYVRAREAVCSPRYAALAALMRRWLMTARWRSGPGAKPRTLGKSARKLAVRLLTKRRKSAIRLGGNFEQLSDAQRHQLRIALKKLRYTAEFFRSLYGGKRAKAYLAALAELQDKLGNLNDVVVAGVLLKQLPGMHDDGVPEGRLPYAVGLVIGWHAHNASSSMRQAYASWREFRDCNPFW